MDRKVIQLQNYVKDLFGEFMAWSSRTQSAHTQI